MSRMPFALQGSDAEEGLGNLSALLPDSLLDSPVTCQVRSTPDAHHARVCHCSLTALLFCRPVHAVAHAE